MGVRNFALYTFFLFVCDLIHFQRLVDCSFETILKRSWNNFETILKQFWNDLETILKEGF
jgi:phosphorylcholine metabolism protein LicD